MQFHELAALWSVSKLDALIWASSFLACVVVSIDFGLFVGIGVSVLVLLSRSQSSSLRRLGRVPGTDLYLDCDKYGTVSSFGGRMVGGALLSLSLFCFLSLLTNSLSA